MNLSYEEVEPYFDIRIREAFAVTYGVLKFVWSDGAESVLDVRPLLKRGAAYAFLRENPKRFADFTIEEHGRHISWVNDNANSVDFGADTLRARAEKQAVLLDLVS